MGEPINLFANILASMERGNFTSRQISEDIGVPQSWVSGSLNQLAEQGLVRRQEKLKRAEGVCIRRGKLRTGQGRRPYRWVMA